MPSDQGSRADQRARPSTADQPVSNVIRRRQQKLAAEVNRKSFTSDKLDMQDWIICDPVLSTNAKVVGVYLLSCINSETGQCNPSIQTIADEVSLAERTVRRALSDLRKAGWIDAARKDRRRSNYYAFGDNRSRANAIDDRRIMLRDARREARFDRPEVAARNIVDRPEVAAVDRPPVAAKHLNRTPEDRSLREVAPTFNQYALASRGS